MLKDGIRAMSQCLALLALAAMVVSVAKAQDPGTAQNGHGGTSQAARPQLGTSALFAPDGSLYAVTREGGHVLLHRSGDAGQTWGAPVVVNEIPEPISADGENRPKLEFARDGGLLVTWTRPLTKRFTGEIRIARSADGERFEPPYTVHRDRSEITHRFESLLVAGDGRVVVTWIDKRDLETASVEGRDYRGAAIYAAVSIDHGRSFAPEVKVADHSCECCRIALANDTDGLPLVFWRHVFEPNERDHALAKLGPDGAPQWVRRATFDRWQIDACPHHGPSLAVGPDGTRHAVWFNFTNGEGAVFYGRLVEDGIAGQRQLGGDRAAHADIAASGERVAIVWKEFDGERTQLHAELSNDVGETFSRRVLAATAGASDQPRVIRRGEAFFAFWRTEDEGMRGYPLP